MEFKPLAFSNFVSTLEIKDLSLNVNLGCSEEERSQPQTVLLGFKIQFQKAPQGCLTDSLQDTFCYDQLSQKIRKLAGQNEFRLIEKLSADIFSLIKSEVGPEQKVQITVYKKAPVEGLLGPASFTLGDF